jgi:hypothetical protein
MSTIKSGPQKSYAATERSWLDMDMREKENNERFINGSKDLAR